MKSDIEIARQAKMLPITEVAKKAGIGEDDLELYGKYKAKLSEDFLLSIKDNDNGKLTVSAVISGNGKTTSVSGTEVTEGDKVINLCKPEPVGFVNTYDTEPVTVVPGGEKELVGRALSDGEFSFTMTSAAGNPKAYNKTVKNIGMNG